MKKLLLTLLLSCGITNAQSPPTPQLTTFYDHSEQVFGMWWVSAGAEYDYILEVNEFDGSGWFTVATWVAPAKNSVMSGYTYIQWDNEAIARVRVRRTEPVPTPRELVNWKVLTPFRF
tara:strand:+ start:6356 stop:6709 length:354 start_codon:yes stop_codon:yes gene_type:complete